VFLEQPIADRHRTGGGRSPILDTASARIIKAYRRMVKRGRGLGDDPPAEALHRLRIDAKKLRYLLEFFRSLYPEKKIDRLVKELKGFQDILGGFNDMEVQQRRLHRFGHALSSSGDDRTETLLAMGRLAAVLEERQEGYRHSFNAAFDRFAAPKSQRRYAALFEPEA
jgi:CHAD domain-containing protein